MEAPSQISALIGDSVIFGFGFTFTCAVKISEQPFKSVPVTEYIVEIVGVAITEEPVLTLRATEGDHK